MKVHVEAKPLHEPLAGGTPGATVAVEPIVAGTGHLVALDDGEPRGALPHPEAVARPAHRQAGDDGALPGIPDPPPERRRDPRRHRPAPVDRDRRARELRRARRPHRAPGPRAGRRRPRAAAQARPRARRGPGRGDDPPAPRPQLGDLRVPARDLRRQRGRVGGGARAGPTRCSTATAGPTTTTPSTTARSTSTAAASTPTRASGAPTTSSATARSASPSPRATAPATCRWSAGSGSATS